MNKKPTTDGSQPLKLTGGATPPEPAFSCLVYVRKDQDGTGSGRVANLDGIEAAGAGERDVLVKLTTEFKSRVAGFLSAGQDIPWIDPPPAKLDNEQIRRIPMHL